MKGKLNLFKYSSVLVWSTASPSSLSLIVSDFLLKFSLLQEDDLLWLNCAIFFVNILCFFRVLKQVPISGCLFVCLWILFLSVSRMQFQKNAMDSPNSTATQTITYFDLIIVGLHSGKQLLLSFNFLNCGIGKVKVKYAASFFKGVHFLLCCGCRFSFPSSLSNSKLLFIIVLSITNPFIEV